MSIMASIDEEEVHNFNMDDELELLPIDSFDPIDVPLPAPAPAEVQANSRFLSEPVSASRGPRFSNPTIERMNSFKYRNAPRENSKSNGIADPTPTPILDPRSIHQSGYDLVETRQRSAVPATALKKMAATKSSEGLLSPKNGATAPQAPSVITTPPRTVPKVIASPPTSSEAPKAKPQPTTEVISTKKPITPSPQVRSTTPNSLSRPSRPAAPKSAPIVASPAAVVAKVPEQHPVAAPLAAPAPRQRSAPRERVSIIHRTAPTTELMSPIRARNAAEAAAAATASSRSTTPVLARSLTPTVSKRPRASVDGSLAGLRSDSGGWNSNVRVKSKTEVDDAIENITRIKQDSGEKPIEKPRRHTPLRNSGAGSFSQHDLSKVYPRNTDPVVSSSAQFFSPTKGTSRSTTPTSRSSVSRSTTPTINSRPTSRSTTPTNLPQRRRPSLGSYMAGDDASELSGGASLGRSVGRAGSRSPGRHSAPSSASLLSPYNLMVSEPNGHALDSDRLSDADLKTVGNQMLLLKLMLQTKAADDAVKEEEDILRAWQIVHATEEQARSLANHDVGIEEVAKAHEQIIDMEILVDKVNDHLAPVFERLNAYIYAKNDLADEHHSNGAEDSQEIKAQSHRELQARLVTLSKSIAALKRSAESGEYAPPTASRPHPTTEPVKVTSKAPAKPVYIPTSKPRTVVASEPPIKKVPVAKPVSKPSSTLLRPTAASIASNAAPHAAPVTSPVPAKPTGRASLGGRTPVDTTKKETKVTPKPVAKVTTTAKSTPTSTPAAKSVTPKAAPGRTSVVPAAPAAAPAQEPRARAVVRPKKAAVVAQAPAPAPAPAPADPDAEWVNEEVHSYDDSDALGGEPLVEEIAGELHTTAAAVFKEQPEQDSLTASPEIFVQDMEYRHSSESAAAYTESQVVAEELVPQEENVTHECVTAEGAAVEAEQAVEEEALPDFTTNGEEEQVVSEAVEEHHPQEVEDEVPAEIPTAEPLEETAEISTEEVSTELPEPASEEPTQETVPAEIEASEDEVLGGDEAPEEPLVEEPQVVESFAAAQSEVEATSAVPEVASVQEETIAAPASAAPVEPAPAVEVPKVVSVDAHLNSMFELQSADSHDASDVPHVDFKEPVLTPEPVAEPALVAVVTAAMSAAAAPVDAELKSPERKARGEAFARLMRRMNQNKDDAASASQSGTEPGTPKSATPTVGMFPELAPAPVETVAPSAKAPPQAALVTPIAAAPVSSKPVPTPSSEKETIAPAHTEAPAVVPTVVTTTAIASSNEMPTSPVDLNTTTSTSYGEILSTSDSAADSITDLPSPSTEASPASAAMQATQPHSKAEPAPVAVEVAPKSAVHVPKSTKEVLSVITEDEASATQAETATKPAGIRALLNKFEDKKASASSFSLGGGQISPSTPGGPGDGGQRLTPKREKSTRLSELMSKFDGAKKESLVPTFSGSQRNVRSSIISIGDITPKKAVFEKDSEAAAEMSSSTESMNKAHCAAEPVSNVAEEAVHVIVEPAAVSAVQPIVAPVDVPVVPIVVPVAAKEPELPPAYSEAVQPLLVTEAEAESTPPLPEPVTVAEHHEVLAVAEEVESLPVVEAAAESPSTIEAPAPAVSEQEVQEQSADVEDEPPIAEETVEQASVAPSVQEPEESVEQEAEPSTAEKEEQVVTAAATSPDTAAVETVADVLVPATLPPPVAVQEAVAPTAEFQSESCELSAQPGAQQDAHILPAQSFERLRAASTNSFRDDDTGSNAGSELSTASKKARRPTLKGLWKRVKSATGMRADDEANTSQYNGSPVPDNRPGTSSGPPSVSGSGLPPSVPRNTVSLNDFFSGTVDNEDEDSGNEGYRYAKEDNNSPFGANGSFGFASSDSNTPMQDDAASNASSNQSKTSTKSKDKTKSSIKGLWNLVKGSTKEKL